MDPFKVLGYSEGCLRSQEDFDKLRQRSKELYKYYARKNRAVEAKRVEQAFEVIKAKHNQFEKRKGASGPGVLVPAGTPSAANLPASEALQGVVSEANKAEAVAAARRAAERRVAAQRIAEERRLARESGPIDSEVAPSVGPSPQSSLSRPRKLTHSEQPTTRQQRLSATAAAARKAQKENAALASDGSAAVSKLEKVLPGSAAGKRFFAACAAKQSSSGGERLLRSRSGFMICSTCSCSVEAKRFRKALSAECFVCPECRIRSMDPYNIVREGRLGVIKLDLVQPPLVEASARQQATFDFSRDLPKLQEWRTHGQRIEVRMCTVDDYSSHQKWPRTLCLHINDQKVLDIVPPEPGHRRRDVPQNISAHLRGGVNHFRVTIQDDYVQRFVFAVVRTTPQSPRQIGKLVPVLSRDQCRQRVVDLLFSSMLEGSGAEVQCSGYDRSRLLCPVSLVRMKTPARGFRCRHLQCFDLQTYLSTNYRIAAFNRRWRCPVCDVELKPSDLFIDTYFLQVQEQAGIDSEEVAFDSLGEWIVTARADRDSELHPEGSFPPPSASPSCPSASPTDGLDDVEDAAEEMDEDDDDDEAARAPDGCRDGAFDEPCGDWDGLDGNPCPGALSETTADFVDVEAEAAQPPSAMRGDALAPDSVADGGASPAKRPRVAKELVVPAKLPDDYVDPLDRRNYIVVELTKPMGCVFEANSRLLGGAFTASFAKDGAAERHGKIQVNDQIVGVGSVCLKGLDFETFIGHLSSVEGPSLKLSIFRGPAEYLYTRGAVVDEFLADLLASVADGTAILAKPAEEEAMDKNAAEERQRAAQERARRARISMLFDGASDDDATDNEEIVSSGVAEDVSMEAFATPLTANISSDELGARPAAMPTFFSEVIACISGAGLEDDLCACLESLPQVPLSSAPRRVSAEGGFVVSILKTLSDKNQGEWALLSTTARKAWRKSAGKRLADVANTRVDQFEREQLNQERVRLAAAAAARHKAATPLLQVEPAPTFHILPPRNVAKLTLTNLSEGNVAFRVKTNAPKQFVVKPCAGCVEHRGRFDVYITFVVPGARIGTAQFLIQSVAIPTTSSMPPERWAQFDKSEIQERCLEGRLGYRR